MKEEAYKRMMAQRYNPKVKPRNFLKVDLVWRKNVEAMKDLSEETFGANWEGSYRNK